jgi:hypothetical protein
VHSKKESPFIAKKWKPSPKLSPSATYPMDKKYADTINSISKNRILSPICIQKCMINLNTIPKPSDYHPSCATSPKVKRWKDLPVQVENARQVVTQPIWQAKLDENSQSNKIESLPTISINTPVVSEFMPTPVISTSFVPDQEIRDICGRISDIPKQFHLITDQQGSRKVIEFQKEKPTSPVISHYQLRRKEQKERKRAESQVEH